MTFRSTVKMRRPVRCSEIKALLGAWRRPGRNADELRTAPPADVREMRVEMAKTAKVIVHRGDGSEDQCTVTALARRALASAQRVRFV